MAIGNKDSFLWPEVIRTACLRHEIQQRGICDSSVAIAVSSGTMAVCLEEGQKISHIRFLTKYERKGKLNSYA